MILSRKCVEKLIDEKNVIEDYNPVHSCDNPAKVELCLGTKCYLSSQEKNIITLSTNKTVTIKPNDLFLYQTLEKVNIPHNIAGRISLKMKHTAKGLLMSNQTQIDPGYHNFLFGMLYNLSDDNVELRFEEPIVTLELYKIKKPIKTLYSGSMGRISFEEFCKKRSGSALGKLSADLQFQSKETKKSIKDSNRYLKILMAFVSLVTIVVTVVTVLVAVLALKQDPELACLTEKVENQQRIIDEMQGALKKLELPNLLPTSSDVGAAVSTE